MIDSQFTKPFLIYPPTPNSDLYSVSVGVRKITISCQGSLLPVVWGVFVQKSYARKNSSNGFFIFALDFQHSLV
jgi:hypothetical protein